MSDEVLIGVEARAYNATIRRQRLRLGLTQKQLAAKAGVSVSVVGHLEQLRIPRLTESSLRVLKLLGLDESASPPWLGALELHGVRRVEHSVSAELVAAPERLGLPMHTGEDVTQDASELAIKHLELEDLHEKMQALTPREQYILEGVFEGRSRDEIARALNITPQRVWQIKREAENRLCLLYGQPPIHGKSGG